MKTFTVTFHAEQNYGAILQAYALQQYLKNCGLENEIIDLRHTAAVDRVKILKKTHSASGIVNNAFSLLRYPSLKAGLCRFNDFVEHNLAKTKRYASYEDLAANPPEGDAYICGSDQIWNITNRISEEFFLQFGAPDSKRISYAASFGVSDFSAEKTAALQERLEKLDAISVRESSGVAFLSNKLGMNAVQTIDPVFLIKDEWQKLTAATHYTLPKKKYILVYSLFNNDLLKDVIRRAKKHYGYEIVQVAYKGFSPLYHDRLVLDAGPAEFLCLIQNAEAVISSSFHGTAFSLIFQKPFLSATHSLTATRVTDLLTAVGLEDRILQNTEQSEMLTDISYAGVEEKLGKLIQQSEDFLTGALEGQHE